MSDVLVHCGHSSDMIGVEDAFGVHPHYDGTGHGGVVQWDYDNRDGVGDREEGHCCNMEENRVEGFEDVLDSGCYEAQLKVLFENCDDSRQGRLGHSGLAELGKQLQLGSRLPQLLHLLLGDDVTATTTFEQFKETLVMFLTSSRADACDEDEPADQANVHESGVEAKDDEVEVEPKYIKGGKRYGRRSRPESFVVDHESHEEATNVAFTPCGEFQEEAVFVRTNGGTFEACGQSWSSPGLSYHTFHDDHDHELPVLTEERVRLVCRGLGLDPARLGRDDAADLCITLGVQQPIEDILPSSADDGTLDLSLLVKTLAFPRPPFLASSTPYIQHSSRSCQEDPARRNATPYQLFSTSPEPLFSALDDGSDCVRAQDVLDLWAKHGVLNGEEVLKALGLAGEVMLSRSDLELALECELQAQRNSVPFAAIASHRAELQGMRCDLIQLGQERDKLKDDLDKAERRCSQLAFEMDEQQELIENLNSSRLGELANEHQDQISSLRADFAREREQATHQMSVEHDRQEEEASSLRVEQALLQQHVSVLLRENTRLEGELLEMAGSLAKAKRHVNELQECRKQHRELDEVHPFCRDSFSGEENFALIIKNYKQQIRELQDRNDELQAENEELQVHDGSRAVRWHEKRLRSEGDGQNSGIVHGCASGIPEGYSPETNVDVNLPNGIGEGHQSASFGMELELEQLKEVHKLELQGLWEKRERELQVSKEEFEQLMATRESKIHKALETQLEELKLSKRLQVEVETELVKTTEELQQVKHEMEEKMNEASEVGHLAHQEELSETRNDLKGTQELLQLLQDSNKATCEELHETKCVLSLSQQETQNLQAALKEMQRMIGNKPVVHVPGDTERLGSVERVRMEEESTNDLQDASDDMNTEGEENFVQVVKLEERCAQKVSDMVPQHEEEQGRVQQLKWYCRATRKCQVIDAGATLSHCPALYRNDRRSKRLCPRGKGSVKRSLFSQVVSVPPRTGQRLSLLDRSERRANTSRLVQLAVELQKDGVSCREKLEDSAVYKDLAEKRAAELDKQNEHLQVKVKTLQDEAARQQAKEEELYERLAEVQASVSRQYEKAKNYIRLETIAAHQEAAARIIRLEVDVSVAEQSVREMAAERIASLNELKDLQSQNDGLLELEREHVLCREEKNKIEKRLQTLLHEVCILNGNLGEVSSQRDKLCSDILLIEQDKESFQKEVSSLRKILKALQDKVFSLEDVQSKLEQARNENASLHEELSRMAQEQAQLQGYEADLAKAQHTISQLEKEIKNRDDQNVQLKAYHESLWKRTVVRMGEVEGNLKGMRAALQEKTAFLNEQHTGEREHGEERKPIDEETTVGLTRVDIFTKEYGGRQWELRQNADLHIKDLYLENARLLRALQQSEHRHHTVERKNVLLEEKVSALNKLLRRLVPEHLLAGL
uniref:ninein-like protein isoform X2 n=1 Tax=Myxine glutinosa TaxID=7769 RepID=UPI00359020DC